MRQMNPLYRNDPIQHFYPCPKCEKGLLKLRHHLCPCDQDTCNAQAVVKVRAAGSRRAYLYRSFRPHSPCFTRRLRTSSALPFAGQIRRREVITFCWREVCKAAWGGQ